ncbi:putative spx domain-containing protein [Phaeoacremonium minimum UCRPA7]|uniref:Putative spx domain-containing protein n=1 Tax=Phaeoacremonium minimum (strain UCR-PA7) TaxID=1286976 RepID=R8BM76_PHAM7|nr:putative spx domain-containing protein [Phaeoacremonium minimum UCRPA7]EOO00355.1 putative spx domain-containing protein [Phaeoacremonium minimum UCRPA7]
MLIILGDSPIPDNIDYNSLKHYIKVHTTKDQARAITILGHSDAALLRVEDELYLELCRQHDRVDLFVASKADEISRRLQYLTSQTGRLISRRSDDDAGKVTIRRQRKLAKRERELLRIGDEIQFLQRFVNAQVVAFRKILKKYKKWTGSTSLGTRFRDNVLSHPKSFTQRDFRTLHQTYQDRLAAIRAASPVDSEPVTPAVDDMPPTPSYQSNGRLSPRHVTIQVRPSETRSYQPEEVRYWNEYDHGSEVGDVDDGYAIYINPDDDRAFPNLMSFLTMPIEKTRAWLAIRHQQASDARQPLLPTHASISDSGYGTRGDRTPPTQEDVGYFTNPPGQSPAGQSSSATAVDTDADDENESEVGFEYASSEEFPLGYEAHYASLPSIEEQRVLRYRERVLFFGTVGCFTIAFALVGIAAVLISTGRHKLRVEVDAGVTVGVVVSLGLACTALGMMLARKDQLGTINNAAGWIAFATVCVLDGMLLVLVMGNTT